jgi:lipoprotein NlpI
MTRRSLLSLCLALPLIANSRAQDVSSRDLMNEGIQAFFDGKIKESVAAFDTLIKASEEIKPQLWQRGLSLYYAEKYQAGREQFEVHQTVNPNDVENAAWHFICVARIEGVEAARKALIPIKGDSRIPMKEVHDLFAGTGSVEAVMKAAEAGDEGPAKRNQLCYAHLYLGLYFEALGENDKAKEHIVKAAIDYKMDHYMGRCAQVHAKLRGW